MSPSNMLLNSVDNGIHVALPLVSFSRLWPGGQIRIVGTLNPDDFFVFRSGSLVAFVLFTGPLVSVRRTRDHQSRKLDRSDVLQQIDVGGGGF